MKKSHRWTKRAAIAGSLGILATLLLVVVSFYGEYGAYNVNLAIREYMRKHDGRWPSCWDDIEPYHRDPLLSIRSVAVVRLFHDVAWDIDPYELFASHGSEAKPRTLVDYEHGALPVVYHRSRRPAGAPVRRWVLTPIIFDYVKQTAATAEGDRR